MYWQFHTFSSLSTNALFTLLKLRVDVFVVEQACAYPELDHFDTQNNTLHVLGYQQDQLVAYARAIPACYPEFAAVVRIGRVVVAEKHRGKAIGSTLMQQVINRLDSDYPGHDQALAAQVAVQDFYASHGFTAESAQYLEDGIAHIDMRRAASVCNATPSATTRCQPK